MVNTSDPDMSIALRNITSLILISVLLASCGKQEKSFYPDGSPRYALKYDSKGRLHGTSTWWYPNGRMELQADYHHGSLHGRLLRWISAGHKVNEDEYVHGVLDGQSLEWDYSGQIIREQNYRKGKLHGPSTKWYGSGQLLEQGQYHHGLLHGHWLYWDVGGNLIARGEYENGQGYQRVFTPNGTEVGSYRFENNRPVDIDYPLQAFTFD